MNEDNIRRRIKELLEVKASTSSVGSHEVFQGAVTVLAAVYGPESPQVNDLKVVGGPQHQGLVDVIGRGDAAKGALRSLEGNLDAGLLGSLRAQHTGAVIADFVSLARQQLDEGTKEVAAVLAAAVYEDTIRRMGQEFAGIDDRPKLADVLIQLKGKGIIKDAQFTIAQSYLKFRNDALHADWEKIERESVMSILSFAEEMILRKFSTH